MYICASFHGELRDFIYTNIFFNFYTLKFSNSLYYVIMLSVIEKRKFNQNPSSS